MTAEAIKTIEELVVADEGAWHEIQEWLRPPEGETERAELLPCSQADANEVLCRLQVSTKSYLGTIAYRSGGILVDDGWLRILGAGHNKLGRSLASWNGLTAAGGEHRLAHALLVADDVLGGFFAINGGAFAGEPGLVFYRAPETLAWESLDLSYGSFLYWALRGDLETFYADFRWQGWRDELKQLSGRDCLSIYPPLWSEGGSIGARARKAVPVDEAWRLGSKFKHMLG